MTPDENSIIRKIAGVNWNFADTTAHKLSANSLHWYPGTFVPQVPGYLIQLLSEPGATVLDPFAGSGTTGFEAIRLGRRATLIDSSLASVQLIEGKRAIVTGIADNALNRCIEALSVQLPLLRPSEKSTSVVDQELHNWFHPQTLDQLLVVRRTINECGQDQASALDVIFADLLFACASTGGSRTRTGGTRRHHWGWIADNVRPKSSALHYHDAIQLAVLKFQHALRVSAHHRELTSKWSFVSIIHGDAREQVVQPETIDLVVTAPPYLNMIDYTLANRLTYLWQRWDMERDRKSEIGARYRRKRRGSQVQYAGDMEMSINQIHASLRKGGYFALVIGASRASPMAAEDVLSCARRRFTQIGDTVCRQPTHRRISDRQGRETFELIGVFRK